MSVYCCICIRRICEIVNLPTNRRPGVATAQGFDLKLTLHIHDVHIDDRSQ